MRLASRFIRFPGLMFCRRHLETQPEPQRCLSPVDKLLPALVRQPKASAAAAALAPGGITFTLKGAGDGSYLDTSKKASSWTDVFLPRAVPRWRPGDEGFASAL